MNIFESIQCIMLLFYANSCKKNKERNYFVLRTRNKPIFTLRHSLFIPSLAE